MHAVQTSCCHLADAARPAARTNGRGRTFCRDITGNSEAYWAAHGDKGPLAGVAGTAKICDVSRAMGLALARAGALGAVARLAQHWVAACEEPQREREAYIAASCMQGMLQAVDRHLPEVRARSAPPKLSAAAGRSWGR